jgi:hypothetical protein
LMLNTWVRKSEKTLKRVRAAVKIRKITQRLRVKSVLQLWHRESKFIGTVI